MSIPALLVTRCCIRDSLGALWCSAKLSLCSPTSVDETPRRLCGVAPPFLPPLLHGKHDFDPRLADAESRRRLGNLRTHPFRDGTRLRRPRTISSSSPVHVVCRPRDRPAQPQVRP